MPSGTISLADVAAKTETLAVTCSRCERAGRYPIRTLIARHGPDFGIPALLSRLSADCPKRASVSAYDVCGVRCPELPAFFLSFNLSSVSPLALPSGALGGRRPSFVQNWTKPRSVRRKPVLPLSPRDSRSSIGRYSAWVLH
jgi:hypothetical protein